MKGEGATKVKCHRTYVEAFDAVNADGLAVAADHEVDGLLHGGVDAAHHGGGPLAHVEAQADQGPEAEQFHAEPVSPPAGTLLQVAEGHQVLDQAIDRGARLTEALGEIWRAGVGVVGEQVEELRRLA